VLGHHDWLHTKVGEDLEAPASNFQRHWRLDRKSYSEKQEEQGEQFYQKFLYQEQDLEMGP
jgi:hypothetical protein